MHKLFNLSSVFICLMAILLLFVASSTANTCVDHSGVITELGSVDIEVDNFPTVYEITNSNFTVLHTFTFQKTFCAEENPTPANKNKMKYRSDETLFMSEKGLFLLNIKNILVKRFHTGQSAAIKD